MFTYFNIVGFFLTDLLNSNATIRVGLKYYIKSGETACESRSFKLIFDTKRNQWLIDEFSEPEMRSCDNT